MTNEIETIRRDLTDILDLFDGQEDINNHGGPNDAMRACQLVATALADLDAIAAELAKAKADAKEIFDGKNEHIRELITERNTIASELDRLRAHALDLSAVPEGWRFIALQHPREPRIYQRFFVDLQHDATAEFIGGSGELTPKAALAAAIERATRT